VPAAVPSGTVISIPVGMALGVADVAVNVDPLVHDAVALALKQYV
jgi:hypothetical protein